MKKAFWFAILALVTAGLYAAAHLRPHKRPQTPARSADWYGSHTTEFSVLSEEDQTKEITLAVLRHNCSMSDYVAPRLRDDPDVKALLAKCPPTADKESATERFSRMAAEFVKRRGG